MVSLLAALVLVASSSIAQEAAPAPAGPTAILEVTSTKPGVTVARIEGRGTGSGYVAGAGTATVYTTYYRDLCLTPCKVELPAGLHELSFYGKGYTAFTEKYDFQPGQTRSLQVDPGSFGVAYLSLMGASLGLASAITGGIFLAIDAGEKPRNQVMGTTVDAALLGGGLVATGLGIWGMKASATRVTEGAPGVAVSGSF